MTRLPPPFDHIEEGPLPDTEVLNEWSFRTKQRLGLRARRLLAARPEGPVDLPAGVPDLRLRPPMTSDFGLRSDAELMALIDRGFPPRPALERLAERGSRHTRAALRHLLAGSAGEPELVRSTLQRLAALGWSRRWVEQVLMEAGCAEQEREWLLMGAFGVNEPQTVPGEGDDRVA